nr:hypothetical protein GCM10020093_026110 [Planobispora longispora]
MWRLKAGDDPRETVDHDYGDHLVINFSVWASREELWNFVYRSAHLPVLQRRREWFLRVAEPYSVMWWIPEGYIPSLAEGMERLELLRREGPTPEAFTFKDFYDAPAGVSASGGSPGPGAWPPACRRRPRSGSRPGPRPAPAHGGQPHRRTLQRLVQAVHGDRDQLVPAAQRPDLLGHPAAEVARQLRHRDEGRGQGDPAVGGQGVV